MFLARLFLSFLLLFGVAPSYAATWWVDSAAGADTNSGLANGPLGSFATIAKAASVAVAGDTINICPGKGYGGGTGGTAVVTISTSGSAAAGPITYENCPGQSMPIIAGTQAACAVCLTLPVSYITIQNLEIAGWAPSLSFASAWVQASSATPQSNLAYSGGGLASEGFTQATVATNSTTAIGNCSLHFASTPAGFVTGYALYDTTNPAAIPAGSIVVGAPGATTTMSICAASPGVSSGDTIQAQAVSSHIQILNNRIHDFPDNGLGIVSTDYLTVQGNVIYNDAIYGFGGPSCVSIDAARDIDAVTTYKTFITGNVTFGCINLVSNTEQVHISMTASGGPQTTTTLTLSANPTTAGVIGTLQVFDRTNPTRIVPGTTVTAVGTSTVTLSVAPQGGGIVASDNIIFSGITDGEGIIIDTNNGTQNGTAGYVGRTLVASNLVFNNGDSGIQPGPNSQNVDAVYNTLYHNQISIPGPSTSYCTGDIYDATTGGTDNVVNNILVAGATNGYACENGVKGGSATWDHNLGFGGSAVGATPATPGTNVIAANPLFVNPSIVPPVFSNPGNVTDFTGFELQPSSAAIDAASATFPRTTNDLIGNPGLVGPSYDVGAYESPCSSYGGNTIQAINTAVNTLMASGQSAGSITPAVMREVMTTLWCQRSPWTH